MYKEPFTKAFKNFRFVLLIPDLLMLIFMALFLILFVWLSGLYSFLAGIDFTAVPREQLIELLKNYISNNYIVLVVYAVLFFILNFMVGASLAAFKLIMMSKIVKKIKFRLFSVWKESLGFAWRVIWLRVIFFLVGIAVIIVLGSLLSLFFLSDSNVIKTLGGIFVFLLLMAVIFLLQLFLYFAYPTMFLKNRKVIGSVKGSFSFVKKNFWYTFVIWFFSVLIAVGMSLIITIPERTFEVFELYYISILFIFIRIIANLFVNIYINLVRFYAYKA